MRPRAMSTAMTPTATPITATPEMSEMKACFRRAVRYRSATLSSHAPPRSVILPSLLGGAAVRSSRGPPVRPGPEGRPFRIAPGKAGSLLVLLLSPTLRPHLREEDHV